MLFKEWFYLAVVIITIIGVAVGRFPVFRMNRATIALVGAALLISAGAISMDEAYRAIDINTIVLLFSMMVINVNLRLCGFFKLLANRILQLAKTPGQLLWLIVFASGFLSAFFLNDTVVIMFTPLLTDLLLALKRKPIPYLIALATAANVGSAATIVGNPQNMIVGVLSQIPFVEFSLALAPPALLGLLVVFVLVKIIYPAEFKKQSITPFTEIEVHVFKPLLYKSMVALFLMVTAFFAGVPVTLAAFAAAALLLFTRRIKPERVFIELDWSLLVFFACLFIVTDVLSSYLLNSSRHLIPQPASDKALFEWVAVAVVLSNLISNVPAVMVLSPIIKSMVDPERLWLLLALSTTFAGNLTLLGSVANLIVAELARKRGVHLCFNEYLKVGVPVTMITTSIGALWIYFFI